MTRLGRAQFRLTSVLALVFGLPIFAAAQASPKEVERPVGFCWDDHPCVRLGPVLVNFTAVAQIDARRSDVPFGSEQEIRRRDVSRHRVGTTGRVTRYFEFQIERELADTIHRWRDAYVNVRAFAALQLKAGLFKLPMSLDEETASASLDFASRAQLATLLAPGRDRGVMLHGDLFTRGLTYEWGMFDHDGRNLRPTDPTRQIGGRAKAGRIVVRPFASRPSSWTELRVGASFTSSPFPEALAILNGRTAFDATYFTSNVFVNGQRRRLGAEAQWRPGPISIAAEFIRTTEERIGESVEDGDLSPVLGQGWYVSATALLTGEHKRDGLPKALFLHRGLGAIEVVARFERLRFGSVATGESSTSPRTDIIPDNGLRAMTVGATWSLNRWFRLQANAIRESVIRPQAGPFPDRSHFWSRVFRLQLAL